MVCEVIPDCRLSAVERKETYDVTATLRLLRLLVKYGEVMDDLFATNVESTPSRAWRKIVPQVVNPMFTTCFTGTKIQLPRFYTHNSTNTDAARIYAAVCTPWACGALCADTRADAHYAYRRRSP